MYHFLLLSSASERETIWHKTIEELENCGKDFSVENVDLWQGAAFVRGSQYREHLKECSVISYLFL